MGILIEYEKKVCSRCGGCGKHSYNQIDGDRCYGCNGTGKQLSKEGKKAYNEMQKAKEAFCKVPAADVKIGMVIKVFVGMMGNAIKWEPVISIEPHNYAILPDGSLKEGGFSIKTKSSGISTYGNVEKKPTAQEFMEIMVPLAKSMKGAKVIENDK